MRIFGFIARLVFIGMVTALAVFWYLGGRIRTLFVRGAEARRAAVANLRGRVLRWSMATMGATFTKLGQVMSTRPDLFASEITDELRKLQDEMPGVRFNTIRKTLEAELGGPLDQHFKVFDEAPVAAASVAQVHRAELLEGDEVAVKVLRPRVRQKIERDASILRFGAKVIALHPKIRLSDPVGHLDHFIEGILGQTDLTRELEHYTRFKENFMDFEGVRFPDVHPELCTEKVLTMEFIHGTKVDELDLSEDHSALTDRMTRLFFKMCFEDGFLHVDLHPGNSLLTEDGDLVIFDVGMAKGLDPALLDQFVDFNRCLVTGDADDFVNHFKTFHTYMEGSVDWDALHRDCQAFATSFRQKNMAELEIGVMLNEIFALGRAYQIRPVSEMMLIMVGMVTAEGVGKMLTPDVNSFEEMGKVLMPLVQKRMMEKAMAEASTSASVEAAV